MSNAPFAFPPPPPPPPRRAIETAQYSQGRGAPQQLGRGRGGNAGFSDQSRPRGHGGFGSRGRGSNYRTTENLQKPRQLGLTQSTPRDPYLPSFATKRPFDAAFVQHKPGHAFSSGTPSGGNVFSQPSANIQSSHQSALPVKKTRGLGLMHSADDSESENDGDEEAALTGHAQDGLSIEYKGSTSTLRTSADIAAWIAERKRKYPTAAKREIAKREAEDRRKKFEAERDARREAAQAARVKGQKEHLGHVHGHERSDVVNRVDRDAGSPSKKHPKTSPKSQTIRDHAGNVLEAAATLCAHGSQKRGRKGDRAATAALDSDPDSPLSSDSDATSSSGSDTDEDTAPDITSSKTETDPIAPEQATKERQVCQFFAKHGHCKWGSRCKHRHENVKVTRAPKVKTGPASTKRKGLWQVMVEKEQEEESKKVLHAIVALGKQGLLDEPT